MNLWFEALPAFLAALLVFTLPGAAVLAALHVRGIMLLLLAPAVSVSVVAVSAITAPLIGLAWGLPVVLLGTAVAAAGAWAAQRFIPALRPASAGRSGWSGLAAVAAGVLLSLAITTALLTLVAPTPEQFTQGYDSVFHLNATEYAVERGNASSFAVSGFILPPGKSLFYPGAWHGLASLLITLTGISVPAATNLVWLVVAGVVWPLSAIFLTRVLFGRRPLLLLCAGIFAAAFPAFPWLLLQYGSAYPNSLSNALVPVGIGLVLMILRPAVHTGLEPAQALAVVALFLPGAVTAQPNGVFSVLLVLTPLLLFMLFAWLRAGFAAGRRSGWLRAALLLVALAVAAGALLALPQIRSLFNYASLAFMPFPLAVLRNATMAPAPIWFPAVALSALVLAGVLAGRRRPGLGWLPAAVLLLVFMYPMTAGTDFGPANVMLAPWWDNPERIAALLPLLAVPLAALGMVSCTDWLGRRLPSLARRKGRPAAVAGLAVVLVLANPGLWQMKEQVGIMYNVPPAPDGLAQVDAQELALIHRLGEFTTPSDVIANNPYNGSALAMALAGRTMLFPYSSQAELTPDQFTLRFWLNRVDSDPEVCAAAKRLGVTHLLDFGTDYIPAFDHPRSLYPGVTLAPDSAGFTLVASDGHARLFKLTTCAGTPAK
ncbi:hypothetical protein JOF48_001222 [Arthrobacter stackebrandtii]|uniref:Uncharacterized protein n=1 Tax=Arthrobacter stackebrandtii TaxID=272161 RepID=A0ABS4YWR2_9MICC|nr:DUF6541 family protein [Arthrobacter stackebrandtii]MBP2412423.1 hypothetical protein [Arthrobacter stackebrandtii]PYH02189.1 hypothetical protein CVV67_01765 [Arthrobacter stackebrandtii]